MNAGAPANVCGAPAHMVSMGRNSDHFAEAVHVNDSSSMELVGYHDGVFLLVHNSATMV